MATSSSPCVRIHPSVEGSQVAAVSPQQALLCIYLTAEAPYHRLGGSTKFDFAASFAYAVLPVLAGPAIAGSEID